MSSKPQHMPTAEVTSRLDDAVLASPADETEVLWLELTRNRVGHGPRRAAEPSSSSERTLLVRVREGMREGRYRTVGNDLDELPQSIRHALAGARCQPRIERLPPLPNESEPEPASLRTNDRQLATLSPESAEELLAETCQRQESASLEWIHGRTVIVNSRKLRRSVAATGATLAVTSGRGAHAGSASASARSLRDLDPEATADRARARRATEQATLGELPPDLNLVLSPEATSRLVAMLNREAFTAHSFLSGTSFLRKHMGVQVFDSQLTLTDDGTDTSGLPFPIDLEGRSKKAIDLICRGVAKTPALDLNSAAELGLAPTGHCLGGDDAQATNLFMRAGELELEELLEAAGDAIWIDRIVRLECRDPARVEFRATVEGVRRIAHGKLGAGLPRLEWEDCLLRAFSSFLGIGRETATLADTSPFLGAITAPAIALADAAKLSAATHRTT